jgi:hypothetical protein
MAVEFDNRWAPTHPKGLHLQFSVASRRFLYCYTHKNACSAMKRVLLATSGRDPEAWRGTFDFAPHRCPARDRVKMEEFDCRFFIYRDPIERVVSLFNNKFVQQTGHEDIFASYRRVTGQPPGDATFQDFVRDYLRRDDSDIDVHCHGQYVRLQKIRYTHAIPMNMLHDEMAALLGRELATRFFAEKTNATEGQRFDDPSSTVPADRLLQRFVSERALPSTKALVTVVLRDALRARYAADYRMIEEIDHPTTHLRRRGERFIMATAAAIGRRIRAALVSR